MNLAHQEDPWLGNLIANIQLEVDPRQAWNQLLLHSTHINWLVTANKSWRLVPEQVSARLRDGQIIVNMSADPFRGWEQRTVEELKNLADRFVVLSGDVEYYVNPQPHICFVPFWYLNQKYTYDPVKVIDQPRTYKLSCLNKVSRYHRIENFMKLRNKPYFKDLLFGMRYQYNRDAVKRQTPLTFYNRQLVAEFEQLIPNNVDDLDGVNPHAVELPAFTDSYINFVTETSIYEGTIFPSEKTWKPFMSGQFGLWLSNPGTVAFLRQCGFDVFDDVFDNHSYDQEVNLNSRIDKIHAIIDQVMSQDLKDLFLSTRSRRQHNIDLFYGQDLENLLTKQCKEYLL